MMIFSIHLNLLSQVVNPNKINKIKTSLFQNCKKSKILLKSQNLLIKSLKPNNHLEQTIIIVLCLIRANQCTLINMLKRNLNNLVIEKEFHQRNFLVTSTRRMMKQSKDTTSYKGQKQYQVICSLVNPQTAINLKVEWEANLKDIC
jgi:hypothetical protein